jgi:uroporphyrin-III C-methyltransferase/precorrin-2 dehydrogenase/sirohydrochlorin ferrochelatase
VTPVGGGKVWIVGAGPGDPELLTRKAVRCLEKADLVLYDGLVSKEALALAPRAQRFCVAKRVGRKTVRQETIHDLMIRGARRGKQVVRLKCGDPFVLGRGGEEGLALRAARVPFEVVPGVSTAVAAPALAGIPVTHRGLASSFTVVSGHDLAGKAPLLRSLAPHGTTLVVLMGIRTRPQLASLLLAGGWMRETPSAVLLGASTAEAYAWTGPLCELAGVSLPPALADAPGTIVVGNVVGLAASLGSALVRPTPVAMQRR